MHLIKTLLRKNVDIPTVCKKITGKLRTLESRLNGPGRDVTRIDVPSKLTPHNLRGRAHSQNVSSIRPRIFSSALHCVIEPTIVLDVQNHHRMQRGES